MQDIILHKRLTFTNDDKKKCLPMVKKILELAQVSRAYGVLSLEAEAKAVSNTFLAKGIELVADGRMPQYVEKILRSLILSDEFSNAEYLEKFIIAEGILAIQQNVSLHEIACLLGAMLGEKFLPEIRGTEMKLGDVSINLFAPTSIAHPPYNQPSWPESAAFEDCLLQLSRGDLFKLLESVSHYNLTTALSGCGTMFIYRIRDGVSERTYTQLCEDLKMMSDTPKEHVISAQEEILELLKELQNADINSQHFALHLLLHKLSL
jgi:hypothetical protein